MTLETVAITDRKRLVLVLNIYNNHDNTEQVLLFKQILTIAVLLSLSNCILIWATLLHVK